jgi:hypothetical protein
MKWFLYIAITVMMEDGTPLHNKFKLAFTEAKHCVEMKKVIDVGISFARLSHDLKIEYSGECKPKQWRINKKGIKNDI